MIREVIKPQHSDFTIKIPNSYINRKIEFIMFPLDESKFEEDIKQKNKKSLRGVFNQYADNSKISLEDNAWKNNVVKTYKNHD